MRLLLIDDELDFASALAGGLRLEGYAVDHAETGNRGWELAFVNGYDAVLLDLNLPDRDGLDVCQLIRKERPETPILMLTARDRLSDVVAGLDLGADDYLRKPFHFAELVARIRALMRRDMRTRTPILRAGDLRMDPAARTVWKGRNPVDLTNKEFSCLEFLMRHPGETITHEKLLEHVWGIPLDHFTNTARVHIMSLRRKLGDSVSNPKYIETVVGQGYRLVEAESE